MRKYRTMIRMTGVRFITSVLALSVQLTPSKTVDIGVVHDDDADHSRPIVVDEAESRRVRREMQAELAEEWWSSNWKVIEEAFLIAFTETDVPPCDCSSKVITSIMVVDFDCKCVICLVVH